MGFHQVILIFFNISFLTSTISDDLQQDVGTLRGVTGIVDGNCMPGPGAPPCEPVPTSMMVLITLSGKSFEMNTLQDSVKSGPDGQFDIKLPVGSYSLFVRFEDEILCGGPMECTPDCVCLPVTISADSVTTVGISVDQAAW